MLRALHQTTHARTHAHTYTHTCTHMHTHTHTHTSHPPAHPRARSAVLHVLLGAAGAAVGPGAAADARQLFVGGAGGRGGHGADAARGRRAHADAGALLQTGVPGRGPSQCVGILARAPPPCAEHPLPPSSPPLCVQHRSTEAQKHFTPHRIPPFPPPPCAAGPLRGRGVREHPGDAEGGDELAGARGPAHGCVRLVGRLGAAVEV